MLSGILRVWFLLVLNCLLCHGQRLFDIQQAAGKQHRHVIEWLKGLSTISASHYTSNHKGGPASSSYSQILIIIKKNPHHLYNRSLYVDLLPTVLTGKAVTRKGRRRRMIERIIWPQTGCPNADFLPSLSPWWNIFHWIKFIGSQCSEIMMTTTKS